MTKSAKSKSRVTDPVDESFDDIDSGDDLVAPEPLNLDDADDLTDVPDEFIFDTQVDDDVDDGDPLNESVPILIDGISFELGRPSDAALSQRAAELWSADNLMDQMLAMQAIVSTSIDRAGYVYVRQQMLGLRVPGKKFNPELIGKLVEIILDRWGGGRKAPELIKENPRPANRGQRRKQEQQRRRRR